MRKQETKQEKKTQYSWHHCFRKMFVENYEYIFEYLTGYSVIERNYGRKICDITSHNYLEKSLLIWSLDEVPLVGPTLPLHSPHAVSTSTRLGTASPSLQIDFLPRGFALSLLFFALSLLFWHPSSQLLKLTVPCKILDSLSPFVLPLGGPALASTWELMDHSLPLSVNDSLIEKISLSLSGCYPYPSTVRNILNQNFLLRTSHFINSISWSVSVFQMTLKLP